MLHGADGETGDGTPDFVLPTNASPRENGVYVVADAVDDSIPSRTNVAPGAWDTMWENLNLGDPRWPLQGGLRRRPPLAPAAAAQPAG